jgi:hypothetical protein
MEESTLFSYNLSFRKNYRRGRIQISSIQKPFLPIISFGLFLSLIPGRIAVAVITLLRKETKPSDRV